jgi:hypothetical protein
LTRASLNRSITFGAGIYSFAETGQGVDSDSMRVWEIPLAALPSHNTGELTTRTDNTDGVITLTTGHNILDATVADLYWTGGRRYGVTIGRAVNAITISGGTGDNLPIASTNITVCTQIEIDDLAITGDNVEWLAIVYSNASTPTARASLDMHDAVGSEHQEDLVHQAALGGCSKVYNVEGGDTNPLATEDIIEGHASHNATTAGVLYVLALIDSTA